LKGGEYSHGEKGVRDEKDRSIVQKCIIKQLKICNILHPKQHCGSGTSQIERSWIQWPYMHATVAMLENLISQLF